MNPTVSILIPLFNAREWIADTIESALAQTWPRKEVFVVDDGSTDGSVDIVKKYESASLKLIRQENGGACRARNRALRECQGDYIQWLDADDLLDPNKIERQMTYAKPSGGPKVLYASGWGTFYYRLGKAKFRPTPLWQDLNAVEWMILRLSNPWMIPNSSWLVSRFLTEKAGPWDERLVRNQDGEYFFRIVSNCNYVKFIPESYCYYRIANPSSVSSIRSRKVSESICLSIDLETQHALERENSDRTRKACIRRLNVGVSILNSEAPDLAEKLHQRIIDLGGEVEGKRPSIKYAFARLIVGKRKALFLKSFVWQIHNRISCTVDRWLYKLSSIMR